MAAPGQPGPASTRSDIVWEDAERGPASQVVNLAANTVDTAIAMDGVLMVLPGTITGLE